MLHDVSAQSIAPQIKLEIPDYKMSDGASLTQNMTIIASNISALENNITILSIDFAYHPEWLAVGKVLPFDISYDPTLKCICASVPITVALPKNIQGGRDIPVTVKGTIPGGLSQLSTSSSLLIIPEAYASVGDWSVIFVSTVVPIAGAAIGVVFVYKRLKSR